MDIVERVWLSMCLSRILEAITNLWVVDFLVYTSCIVGIGRQDNQESGPDAGFRWQINCPQDFALVYKYVLIKYQLLKDIVDGRIDQEAFEFLSSSHSL